MITAFDQLVADVAAVTAIRGSWILGKSRSKLTARARHIVRYLAREDLGDSYPMIAELVGDADHTSAMHSYRLIAARVLTDPEMRDTIDRVRWLRSTPRGVACDRGGVHVEDHEEIAAAYAASGTLAFGAGVEVRK